MKKVHICLTMLVVAGVLCVGLYLINQREIGSDNFVVSIRVPEPDAYDDDGLNFDICIQNLGETPISFEEDNLAQIQINGHQYEFHTDAATLKAGEKSILSVCIPYSNLRKDGTSNTVTVESVSVKNSKSVAKFTFNQA